MKRVTAPARGLLHVEAPGVIVNIRTGLTHERGEVTAVEIMADGDRYAGDPQWWIVDNRNRRAGAYRNVRVMHKEDR